MLCARTTGNLNNCTYPYVVSFTVASRLYVLVAGRVTESADAAEVARVEGVYDTLIHNICGTLLRMCN